MSRGGDAAGVMRAGERAADLLEPPGEWRGAVRWNESINGSADAYGGGRCRARARGRLNARIW